MVFAARRSSLFVRQRRLFAPFSRFSRFCRRSSSPDNTKRPPLAAKTRQQTPATICSYQAAAACSRRKRCSLAVYIENGDYGRSRATRKREKMRLRLQKILALALLACGLQPAGSVIVELRDGRARGYTIQVKSMGVRVNVFKVRSSGRRRRPRDCGCRVCRSLRLRSAICASKRLERRGAGRAFATRERLRPLASQIRRLRRR